MSPGTEDCQPDPSGGGARVVARGFGWHHPGRERPAFSGLDLEIAPGEKVLLLGPSGAGKSTLLHALAGVLEDDEDQRLGSVVVDGRAPTDSRGAVGLMQQDPEASVVMARVGEDLAFGPENLGVDPALIPERSREALEAVGLDLDLGRSTSALSGGQKQRLGLAGILAMRPSLLLLDEPTANLDPAGVEEVRDAVLRAAGHTGATLVVVEHRVGTWAPWMDRVVVLSPGEGVSHEGPPESVLSGAREELVGAGIWVPGLEPVEPAPQTSDECQFSLEPLLVARDLAVTREQPTRRWEKRRRKAARTAPVPPTEEQAQQEPWARAARMAAAGIRARVLPGRHLAVLGPNGCGKSTFVLALAGLAWPGAGTVAAGPGLVGEPGTASEATAGLGWDPMAWPSPELARRIGTVFQEPEHQFMRTTVRQELELGARMAGDVAEVRTEELLEVLRLDSVAEANPFTLSGGEKRRLSVGTALAARPAVLVLDEPTFGQDALTWAALVRLLRGLLSEGTAVVSVTHDAEFVAALGGEVLELGARVGTSTWTPRGEGR